MPVLIFKLEVAPETKTTEITELLQVAKSMMGQHICQHPPVYLKQMFYFKNHTIPKYNIIATNELIINYIQLFYILISFESLV